MKDYDVREEKRGKVHGLRVHFDADAAPSEAIELIWDVERFTRSFPDVLSLEILEQSETHQRVRYVIDAKFKKLSYVLNRNLKRDETTHEVTWSMVKGDLRSVDGAWRISSRTDGRSDIEYESFVDASVFIPSAVIRQGALQKVDEMVVRVRQLLEAK